MIRKLTPRVSAIARELELEQITMLCSRSSFLRKQESRPPAPAARWMPDHVRHDESPLHGESLS